MWTDVISYEYQNVISYEYQNVKTFRCQNRISGKPSKIRFDPYIIFYSEAKSNQNEKNMKISKIL